MPLRMYRCLHSRDQDQPQDYCESVRLYRGVESEAEPVVVVEAEIQVGIRIQLEVGIGIETTEEKIVPEAKAEVELSENENH
jgi:hypothetical protein